MGLTDENKSVEQSYFYDEFGISLGSWGNVGNHYLYTGQEYDGSITQLYNLRARYYKPSIGRFTSEDPMLNPSYSQSILGANLNCPSCWFFISKDLKKALALQPMGLNVYLYCTNNPVNFADPSGLVPKYLCLPLAMLKAYAKTAYGKADEAMKHCVYSCEIARECGSFTSVTAGAAKEITDYIFSKIGRWPGTPSLADMGKNMTGIGCADEPDPCSPDRPWDCFECCSEHLGK